MFRYPGTNYHYRHSATDALDSKACGRGKNGKISANVSVSMKLDLQFIKHPSSKERLVVMPESQFYVLEKAARLGSERNDLEPTSIPKQLLNNIAGGESPIRALRLWRGLSGRQLAGLAGITPSMLSQIERTGKTGSTKTFRAIANVLNVPVDLIFPRSRDDC